MEVTSANWSLSRKKCNAESFRQHFAAAWLDNARFVTHLLKALSACVMVRACYLTHPFSCGTLMKRLIAVLDQD